MYNTYVISHIFYIIYLNLFLSTADIVQVIIQKILGSGNRMIDQSEHADCCWIVGSEFCHWPACVLQLETGLL